MNSKGTEGEQGKGQGKREKEGKGKVHGSFKVSAHNTLAFF